MEEARADRAVGFQYRRFPWRVAAWRLWLAESKVSPEMTYDATEFGPVFRDESGPRPFG